MTDITKEIVLAALKRIAAPDGRGNIVSAGLVSEIAISEGKVMFALNTEPQHVKSMEAPARRRGKGGERAAGG